MSLIRYLAFLWVCFPCAVLAQNTIVVNTQAGKDTISRHIYGHFAEHLGRCIYGGFYVGEDNKDIPNIKGVRKDVVEALKKLQIPNLRWPGGCFADTYHWKDGVGEKSSRPSMLNIWWGNVREDNSFGTDEFLNMCELLGTEPYLSGNVGSGTPQELADWVKYTTHPNGSSPMPEWRQKNGRSTPWKVKYWGIGNEAWGCGGNMTAEYYANVYRQFATFTTNWNNSDKLFRIASGAAGGDYHWTETLMKNIPHNLLEAIALHHYSVIDWSRKGPSTTFDEATYFKTMQQALHMEELVQKHTAIMDQYDPKKKVALFVDEWGGWYDSEPGTNGAFLYQQNTMRDAMIAGTTLNTFNNHCDRVKMANLAQAVNVLQAVILTDGEKMLLTPTYHVMEMYKVHHDAVLLPIQLKSGDYQLGDEKLPAVSAAASRDKRGKIHLSLVNIHAREGNEVSIAVEGLKPESVAGRVLTSGKLQDYNSFENPNLITPQKFTGFTVLDGTLKVSLPPFSVVVLELETASQGMGLKDYYKAYFPIGTAVKPAMMDAGADADLILSQFSSMTAENAMKMGPIHPKENQYNWAPADKIANFAAANGLKLRGHALCWHNQTPDWFFVDAHGKEVSKEVLLARLKEHITTVVKHYKGKIYAWDVVNEAVPDGDGKDLYRKSKFYEIIGETYIEKAFEYAHAADPDALLFYNDYNTESASKRVRIYQLLKKLKDKGVPIHGVGLQGHWSIYEPTAAELEESITLFAGLDLQVHITELDVSVYPKEHERRQRRPDDVSEYTPEMETKQAAHYQMLFEVFRKHKDKITSVTFWNLSDKSSWLDNFPVAGRKDYPLLFDTNNQPKKAYYAVANFK